MPMQLLNWHIDFKWKIYDDPFYFFFCFYVFIVGFLWLFIVVCVGSIWIFIKIEQFCQFVGWHHVRFNNLNFYCNWNLHAIRIFGKMCYSWLMHITTFGWNLIFFFACSNWMVMFLCFCFDWTNFITLNKKK